MQIHDPHLSLDEFKKKTRKKTKKHDLEGAVLHECIMFLSAHEQVVYVERRNTGAVQFDDGFFLRFGATGAADIWCLILRPMSVHAACGQGRQHNISIDVLTHVEIECKRRDGKGRLSEGQKEFQQFCAEAGIPYFVVTSAEDLGKKLHEAGILS